MLFACYVSWLIQHQERFWFISKHRFLSSYIPGSREGSCFLLIKPVANASYMYDHFGTQIRRKVDVTTMTGTIYFRKYNIGFTILVNVPRLQFEIYIFPSKQVVTVSLSKSNNVQIYERIKGKVVKFMNNVFNIGLWKKNVYSRHTSMVFLNTLLSSNPNHY